MSAFKFLKGTYRLITFLATLGGFLAFLQYFYTDVDYDLALSIKNSFKVIENNNKSIGISINFKGHEINSLHSQVIELENTGSRAITKDYIFQPLSIEDKSRSTIYAVISESPFIKFNNNKITFFWDLLNPDEKIKALVYSSKPLDLNLSFRIKEINKINLIDELKEPPRKERLKKINILWLIFLFVFLIMSVDSILLIKEDPRLGSVLGLAKSLSKVDSVNDLDTYLKELNNLYEDYYKNVHLLFVSPKDLQNHLETLFKNKHIISGNELEILRIEILKYVMSGNLYTIRAYSFTFAPILFGFCFIRLVILLV